QPRSDLLAQIYAGPIDDGTGERLVAGLGYEEVIVDVHVGDNVEFVLQAVPLDGRQPDLARRGRTGPFVLFDDVLSLGPHGHDQVALAAQHRVDERIVSGCNLTRRCEGVGGLHAAGNLVNLLQGAVVASRSMAEAVYDEYVVACLLGGPDGLDVD